MPNTGNNTYFSARFADFSLIIDANYKIPTEIHHFTFQPTTRCINKDQCVKHHENRNTTRVDRRISTIFGRYGHYQEKYSSCEILAAKTCTRRAKTIKETMKLKPARKIQSKTQQK